MCTLVSHDVTIIIGSKSWNWNEKKYNTSILKFNTHQSMPMETLDTHNIKKAEISTQTRQLIFISTFKPATTRLWLKFQFALFQNKMIKA